MSKQLVLILFVESVDQFNIWCYPLEKEIDKMPNKIIIEDIIDEMLDNISCIKLNTYIELEKK